MYMLAGGALAKPAAAPSRVNCAATMQASLEAAAAAINELRESLEETSLSPIAITECGTAARFDVRSEDGATSYAFTATFADNGSATLACRNGARGLAKANAKLGTATLPKAVVAAGRCVAVDVSWVKEALEDGAPPRRVAIACVAAATSSTVPWRV